MQNVKNALKTDQCFYCNTQISIPINQSMVKCPGCRKINIFLCHIINPQQKLCDIVCLKCSSNLILLCCTSCKGFQGFSKSQNNIKNGMKHQCPCGSIFTLIFCPNCSGLLSIKGNHSHQLSDIECKNCEHIFLYKICDTCRNIIYKQHWDNNQIYICSNNSCPKSNVSNPYEMGEKNQFYINRLSEFEQKEMSKTQLNQTTSEKQLCKVCLQKQANMINTKCYHLAVCQNCSLKLKKQCPICRATGGDYKKIFKA